ncbi:MAG TPA: TonB-dependent receptor, partial [Terriglobales bacterium]|nr:TonB-dependent receptor [Terriglobales bacterium]
GFTSPIDSQFVVSSLAHTLVLSDALLNQARIGFVRTNNKTGADAPFQWSDVGVAEGATNRNNELPSLSILGSVSMAAVTPRNYTQNSFTGNDILSFFKGAHSVKLGGSLTRIQDDLNFGGGASLIQFLSWPDFLLGLDGNANGTGNFSNVFQSADIFGLLDRKFRVWEGSAFAQDDFRITRTFTLNAGLRYERIGHFADELGRNASFDISKADVSPPPGGSFAGYIVGSNFPDALPSGVIRVGNTFGNYGKGQNAIAPRIGFALQLLPDTSRFYLTGGYGVYHSRPTGQTATQSVIASPFSTLRSSIGPANVAANFQTPFAQPFPTPASFPSFIPYSPTTATTVNVLAPNFRPAIVQEFSLNFQTELPQGWLLDTGYVGDRGTHLQRFRSLNQALSASSSRPINGATANTVSNIGLRVPIRGIRPDSLREMESEGSSWYNALEVSLTKRLSRRLQFLASYTFAKALDTDGADINSTSSGNALTLGDQNLAGSRWGRASFDRTHRFVLSTTFMLPGPLQGLSGAILGHWSLAAIATIQSGSALTIANTNSANVFGISQDRAQLSGTCAKSQLVARGTIESKLNGYFNSACFTKPPVVGADGLGTAFGNSGTGIVDGPGQANLDLAVSKKMTLAWPVENSSLQFRAEFFNACNHPQFANPDTNFSSATFGVIASTAVNPRVGQLALTYAF